MLTNGPPWPQQALVHQKCFASPSGKLHPNSRTEEHWQAPVPHFLPNGNLSSTIGSPSKKTRCPWLPPVPIGACTVGAQAASSTCTLDGRAPQFLLGRSSIPQAGWQMHLPWGPALGDHAGNCGKLTFLLPSALIQQHKQTSFAG